MNYDRIIIGAGLYGLYAARRLGKQGLKVLVLERDSAPFMRATYINQARIHMGYHYPRSLTTAAKSAGYFKRFCEEFSYCLHKEFDQVYATSSHFSWTSASEFRKFCKNVNIRCDSITPEVYFNPGMCDGAFLTTEYTYDAHILRDRLLSELAELKNVDLHFNERPVTISPENDIWNVKTTADAYSSPFILNATYAGINDIHKMVGVTPFEIKYEKCEIILCDAGEKLKDVGITVMDGPFFSIMPFGKTGLHSLTSVTFTPHETSYDCVATYSCQSNADSDCSPGDTNNCNECKYKPESAWPYMSKLARKYLRDEYEFTYKNSLYSIKPILKASEIDDSRPTVIKKVHDAPVMYSVLSGKINTIYDLDEVLDNEQ